MTFFGLLYCFIVLVLFPSPT